MEQVFNVSVRNRIAEYKGREEYICGNSGYIIRFDFDDEWAKYNVKTARLVTENGTYDVLFEGNECELPILSDTWQVGVGVYAGNLRTSTKAYIPAKKSILCGSDTPSDPPKDVYAQIMEKVNDAVDAAKDVQERADAGEFDGKPGEPGKDATAEALELIETITMTEAAWLNRTAEPDGTPYAFKKMLVLIETTVDAPGFNTQLYGDTGNLLVQNWMYERTANGKTWHALLRAELENGVFAGTAASAWCDNAATNTVVMNSRVVQDTAIVRLGFSVQMLPGMTIRIYGVRA